MKKITPKKFTSNKDESVRMFSQNYLEALTKVHPVTPLVIFVPVIAYVIYRALFNYHATVLSCLGFFGVGLAIWTFTEYTLHRFMFHIPVVGPFSEKIYFTIHGVHHDYPRDSRRLVMPPTVAIPLSYAFFWLFSKCAQAEHALPAYAGFMMGYLWYDMTHFAIHHLAISGGLFQKIKSHHLKHHYQDNTKGFGVSSPLWDFIFGSTFQEVVKPGTSSLDKATTENAAAEKHSAYPRESESLLDDDRPSL